MATHLSGLALVFTSYNCPAAAESAILVRIHSARAREGSMALILVIDDDDLVSRTLQRALKIYDYQVMTASSGIEGLQLARRHRPDLFILDIMMPGVDG